MRLIDADKLKAEFTGNFDNKLWHYTAIRAMIDTEPTVDAVEVGVRIARNIRRHRLC